MAAIALYRVIKHVFRPLHDSLALDRRTLLHILVILYELKGMVDLVLLFTIDTFIILGILEVLHEIRVRYHNIAPDLRAFSE